MTTEANSSQPSRRRRPATSTLAADKPAEKMEQAPSVAPSVKSSKSKPHSGATEASVPTRPSISTTDSTSRSVSRILPQSELGVSFAGLGLDFRLLAALDTLGWTTPTPVQNAVVTLALAGRDVLAQARTGSGKTGAFALPIYHRLLKPRRSVHAAPAGTRTSAVRAVVVCPTRDLASQTCRALARIGRHVPNVVAPLDVCATAPTAAALTTASIVVGTPGRLLRAAKLLDGAFSGVEILVLDEADALVAASGEQIGEIRRLCTSPQVLVTTATLPASLSGLRAKTLLTAPVTVRLEDAPGTTVETMIPCRRADRLLCVFSLFHVGVLGRGEKSLLFVDDIAQGYRLKLILEMAKIRSAILHQRLPANSRGAIVDAFNAGAVETLIAVDPAPDPLAMRAAARADAAAGTTPGADDQLGGGYGVYRGVDFVNVSTVVSVDAPHSVASYVHRVGRTGRGLSHGTGILLTDPDEESERVLLRRIHAHQLRAYGEPRPREHEASEGGDLHAAMEKVRYRIDDALRRLTKKTLRAAELADLDMQIVNSERLAAHFEANPTDLSELKRAAAASKATVGKLGTALADLPDYLLGGGLTTVEKVEELVKKGEKVAALDDKTAKELAETEEKEAVEAEVAADGAQSAGANLPARAGKRARDVVVDGDADAGAVDVAVAAKPQNGCAAAKRARKTREASASLLEEAAADNDF